MNKIAFAFGRFNPPTIGHQLIFDKLLNETNHILFVSKTHDNYNNPISVDLKIRAILQANPLLNIDTEANPYAALEMLSMFYDHITFFCGGDRYQSFQSMHNYKEKFGYKSLKIISVGDRNENGSKIQKISGTKVRQYALNGNFEKFKKSFMPGINNLTINAMYQQIRSRMIQCQTIQKTQM